MTTTTTIRTNKRPNVERLHSVAIEKGIKQKNNKEKERTTEPNETKTQREATKQKISSSLVAHG